MNVPLPPWLFPPQDALPFLLTVRLAGTGAEQFLGSATVPPGMSLRIATVGLIGGTFGTTNLMTIRLDHPALRDLTDLMVATGNNSHMCETPIFAVVPQNETVNFYGTGIVGATDHTWRFTGWFYPEGKRP